MQEVAVAIGAVCAVAVPVGLGVGLVAPGVGVPWVATVFRREVVVAPGVTDAPQPATASARVVSGTPVRRAVRRLLGRCRTRILMLPLPA
ncbi:hypothetical protein GPN2_13296 [Streptomyces murinus]